MRAVFYEKYGAPEVLQITEIEKPVPKEKEVLIKVQATTVTSGDIKSRSANYAPAPSILGRMQTGFSKPKKAIIGMELAGVIVSVGKDVTKFKAGDEIYASTYWEPSGSYAEYVTMPETGMLALKPSNLSYGEAATVPSGAQAALYFLRSANIQRGQKVLIYGASGSVGTFAVQIAKYYGAEVTGVCSTANLELVKGLGADHVIDYKKEDFTENGVKYDVIFDAVGKSNFSKTLKSLTKTGYYLLVIFSFSDIINVFLVSLTSSRKAVIGTAKDDPTDLDFLRELVEAGHLKPVIDRSYRFENIVEAHRYVGTGRKRGNVIINLEA